MKIIKPNFPIDQSVKFHTGVKALIDRKIGGINVLKNDEILEEQTKLKNMRNGKVRP